ncbi:MAG: sugar ABC transporter permease [Actinobacteria bacterium]|nr:sugar ABC transporter permease [Actinomycetota bacterium]
MAAVAERVTLGRRLRRWEGLPYWLILPTLAYLALFFAWPMVKSFQLAFQDDGVWTLQAFRTMVNDIEFGNAVRFTLLLIVVIIPVQFLLALVMALLVNAKLRGRGIFLYIFLLPLAISDLAAGIVWSSMFTELGYLNTVLERIGLLETPFIWINASRESLLLLTVVVAEIWRSTALIMIILVAGLQGIPRDYTEAAEVFGAGLYQRVRYVILPMLKPSIQVALLLRLILAFEVFSTVIAITGRGSTVLAAEAWRWQTANMDANVAAAYASLILVLSVVSAGLVLGLLRTPKEQIAR